MSEILNSGNGDLNASCPLPSPYNYTRESVSSTTTYPSLPSCEADHESFLLSAGLPANLENLENLENLKF